MKKSMVYIVSLACALFLVIVIGTISAQQNIEAIIKASPEFYNGGCPKSVIFMGTITAPAGKIEYEYVVNDGEKETTIPGGTLDFASAGKQDVKTQLVFGDEDESTWGGWVAIRVKSPAKVESNKANYKVRCKWQDLT